MRLGGGHSIAMSRGGRETRLPFDLYEMNFFEKRLFHVFKPTDDLSKALYITQHIKFCVEAS